VKLVYLAFLGNRLDGVTKKILSQHSALRSLNVDCDMHFFASSEPEKRMKETIRDRETVFFHHCNKNMNRLTNRRWKFREAKRIIDKYTDPDLLLYIRDPGLDFLFCSFLSNLKHEVVVEFQDLHTNFVHRISSPYTFVNELLFKKKILRSINGAVAVTEKLRKHLVRINKSLPVLTNPNGISVEEIPLRETPYFSGSELNLLFVGSMYRPQGIDRVMQGLSLYYEHTREKGLKVNIFIAGTIMDKYVNLAKKLGINRYIHFLGYTDQSELDSIFNKCHIALSVLAIHRKGDGSPLKNREYTARGIPFVDSTEDNDFPEDWKYRLKVESSEEPLRIEQLIEFANNVLADVDHRNIMRQFAQRHLTWELKCLRLIEFLQEIDTF